MIMWFQKISIPPPRRKLEISKELGGQRKYCTIPPPQRELEIPKGRGEGVKDPGNCTGKGGCMIDLVSGGPLIQYGFECQL